MSITNAPTFPQAAPLEAAPGEVVGGQGRAPALAVSAFAMILGGLGLGLVAANHADPAGFLGDYFTGSAVMALTFPPVAALVLFRRGPRLIGWVLALIGFSHGIVAVAYGLAAQILHSGGSPVAAAWLAWITPFPWIAGMALLTVFLPLLFPDGRLLSARWRPIVGLAALWIAFDAVAVAIAARPMVLQGLPGLTNPAGIPGAEPLVEALQIWEPIWLITMIAALASLAIRFRRAEGRQRQQLKWLAFGTGLFVSAMLLVAFVQETAGDDLRPLLAGIWLLAIPIVPVSVGIAILRYRLFDIDVVISRSLVYGVLTVGVLGTYVVIVGGLGAVFGSSGNLLIAIVATGVAAVLFEPARARVQRWVNHLLFGDRDDPYGALSRLGRRLEHSLAPADVLPTVVTVVAEALRLPFAAIALGVEGQTSIVAAFGQPVPDSLSIPLVHKGERIGDLRLGRRRGDDGFSVADRRLLDDFARQVALAAHAVRTTAELQVARERLVATREVERRRLRRDVHDELGAQLAGLNVQLSVLRGLIKTDAVAADQLALELRGEIRAAIGGVRRILQDLGPTVLDQSGLPDGLPGIANDEVRQGAGVNADRLDLPVPIGIAMLRDRRFDINVVLSRTTAYGVLTVGVVGTYVLIVGGLGAVFGSTGNQLIAVVATGVVAVMFEPARARVHRAMNRLVFGDRHDPYAALSRLGRRLEETMAPTSVLPTVVSVVAETLRLPYVAIALVDGGNPSIVAASGEPVHDTVSVPLVHNGERVGTLLLGRRAGDEAFGAADRRLLQDFARQVALAAHAVRMAAALEAARGRLVTTREEERRRLRRELHDELGTQLAGLNMQMGLLRRLIESDAAAADQLALELRGEIRTAIAGVRRILRDLRPTALDQLGLKAALRAIADQAERNGLDVTVELADDLAALPAAIDVAAYRIVQEAFANIARHAHARTCGLRVWVDGGLHVVVRDDGIGLSEQRKSGSGVGMSSMRERAAELGGRCVISSGRDGGTIVTAVLPVPAR